MELILAQACRGDVVTVMVDGDIVLDDGKPTRFDLDEAGAELAQSLAATPFPAEGAALARELAPYLESWYERLGDAGPLTIYRLQFEGVNWSSFPLPPVAAILWNIPGLGLSKALRTWTQTRLDR